MRKKGYKISHLVMERLLLHKVLELSRTEGCDACVASAGRGRCQLTLNQLLHLLQSRR